MKDGSKIGRERVKVKNGGVMGYKERMLVGQLNEYSYLSMHYDETRI